MIRRLSPPDRAKTEHIATVDRVVWCDADAGRVIVALTDGLAAVGPGQEEQFPPGSRIRFLGRWDESAKYGFQFKFGTFTTDEPCTRKGQIDYLVQYAGNVGRKTAERLCDAFGEHAVKTLRERPDEVARLGIMSSESAKQASADLATHVAFEKTKIELFDLLKGRGFPEKLLAAVIRKWGARAPAVIRRNPLTLVMKDDLPGCSFKRCDKLYTELGKPPHKLSRQTLCGLAALRENSSGDTWHKAETFVAAVRNAIGPASRPVAAIKFGLRIGWLQRRRDESNQLWLAESEKAIAESRIAQRVKLLASGPNLWPKNLPVSELEGDGLPSVHQRDTILQALSTPIGILSGGPGTGKTHTLAFVLRELIREFGSSSIAVCAPTGKAAVRATQSLQRLGLPIKATTIHRLLVIGRNGHDGQGWGFVHCIDNPLPIQFLIADESSMDDTSLLADLLDACCAPGVRSGKSIENGLWKIGYSADPARRVKQLEEQHGLAMEVKHTIRTGYAPWLEHYLHTCFALKRVTGEWFDLDDADVALLRNQLNVQMVSDLSEAIVAKMPGKQHIYESMLFKGEQATYPDRFVYLIRPTNIVARLDEAMAKKTPGTHVLLVGDPFQLAPVGHGAPLRDLIEVAKG